jgi:mono/diheme cytochrome c family protein
MLEVLVLCAALAGDTSPAPAKADAGAAWRIRVDDVGARPVRATPAEPSLAYKIAHVVMAQRCALCHGASGRSDGLMSQTLKPQPRKFSDLSWQSSVDDARIAKAIVEGGVGVGLSPAMPPNPDLAEKPGVVTELVALVRSFGDRGVVRAQLLDAKGGVLERAEVEPDDSGAHATLVFPRPVAGASRLSVWLDVDADGEKDEGEPSGDAPVSPRPPPSLKLKRP